MAHQVTAKERATSVATPVNAASGITFAVGTAPVHTVNGKVNEPIMAMTYAEAVDALGYSDDWEKFTLCEVMYSHFKLYKVAPVIFVNVLDPAVNKTHNTESVYEVSNGKITLPYETINNSVLVIKSSITGTGAAAKLEITQNSIGFAETPTQNTNFRVQFGADEAASVNVSTGAVVPTTPAEFVTLFIGTSFALGGKVFNASVDGATLTYTASGVGVSAVISNTVRIFGINSEQIEHEIGIDSASYTSVFTQGTEAVTVYVKGEDYEVYYESDKCVVERIDGGAIPADATALKAEFDVVDLTDIDKNDIIGGYNPNTKKNTGFECLDDVFPKYKLIPDILIAPKYSQDSEVAAIMNAKTDNINGLFDAVAVVDVDTTSDSGKFYSDVPAWKTAKNIFGTNQILCYPKVKLGEREFWLSTQLSGLMAQVDNNDENGGVPVESPSNKSLQIDTAVTADSSVVMLDPNKAGYLNDNGVVTAINFIGGYKAWGNKTACFPANTDVKDYWINVNRTFKWIGKSVILTYWSKLDKNVTPRFVKTIDNSVNAWLNGLSGAGKLLGARAEFREDENPIIDLMSGKIRFHLFIGGSVPAEEIEFTIEYDVSYLQTLFS